MVRIYDILYGPPGHMGKAMKTADGYYEGRNPERRVKPEMTPYECEQKGGHVFRCYIQVPGFLEYVCTKCMAMLRYPNEIWG